MVRLSDLARETGLNIATVSRALRSDPRVRGETRARVQQAADRLGYRPHWGARALAEGRSRTVWLLLPGLGTLVEREPALWAGRWLLERGYDLLLAQHYGDPGVYARLLDRLAHGGADGALVIPTQDYRPDGVADRDALARGAPLVYVDRRVEGVPTPWAGTDNFQAAGDLVRRAWAGSRDRGPGLAWVADRFLPHQNPVEAARSQGLRAAALDLGVPVIGPGESAPPGRPDRPGLVAGSRFPEVVALAPSFPGTLWVAVFDEGAAGGAFSRVFVARQDFQALGEGAARLLFDGLTNPGGERRDLLVPIKDIVDETGTRN